jgi:hypothetical protein
MRDFFVANFLGAKSDRGHRARPPCWTDAACGAVFVHVAFVDSKDFPWPVVLVRDERYCDCDWIIGRRQRIRWRCAVLRFGEVM